MGLPESMKVEKKTKNSPKKTYSLTKELVIGGTIYNHSRTLLQMNCENLNILLLRTDNLNCP